MKFPMSEDFGGFTHSFMSAMDRYLSESNLLQAELRGMLRKTIKSDEFPKWPECFSVSGPLPWPEDMEPAINNLAGITMENEKEILDTAKGITDGQWFIAVKV